MASDLAFGWEKIADLFAEPNTRELVLAQYEEFGGLKDKVALDPDFARMQAAEEIGVYRIWAGRRDGLLIGFIEWQIGPTWHHKSTKYAIDCGHYIHPAEAGGAWTWLKMWRSALAALQDLGVQIALSHDNPRRPLHAAFARLGFEPAGQMYVRAV